MNLKFAALALAFLSFNARADFSDLFTQGYAAGGGGGRGANVAIGAGTKVDALEISAINLGRLSGTSTGKFVGLSVVQNATPKNGFNFLFRLGVGRATTRFADGAVATRSGWSNGIFLGLGEQYQINNHFLLRAEVYRITYAATPDAHSMGTVYPVTLSALLVF